MPSTRDLDLESSFPALLSFGYEITSEKTLFVSHPLPYNCIAYAAGDNKRWWQYNPMRPEFFWPPVLNDGSLQSLIDAFEWIGYHASTNGNREWGKQKVALYATVDPSTGFLYYTHAARQLFNGKWSSKCGQNHDITHSRLEAIYCPDYGTVACYMYRWWHTGLVRWLKTKTSELRGRIRSLSPPKKPSAAP